MDFLNQSWFWVGFFTAAASIGGILIKELISSRSQLKIERLKIYESDLFKAYNSLYHFVSIAYNWLFPPNEPVRDFCDLMKTYSKEVKPQFLFYSADIRKILDKLESQYRCIGDQDLIPEKPFDEFYDKDLLRLLEQLENSIKDKIDRILENK
jgi:hypothetical protein